MGKKKLAGIVKSLRPANLIDKALHPRATLRDAAQDIKMQSIAAKKVLGKPHVMKRMREYLKLHGQQAMSDPIAMAGQITNVQNKYRKAFLKNRMRDFADEAAFNHYLNFSPTVEDDMENYVEEMESQEGFMGFDDEDEVSNFAPLLALAASPKVRGLIKKVGGKVVQGIKKVVQKKQQAQALDDQGELMKSQAAAIQAGVPAQVINENMADKKALVQVGKTIVDKNAMQTKGLLDDVKDVFEEYKKSEKDKEVMKMMPIFIVLGIVLIGAGFMFAKKA